MVPRNGLDGTVASRRAGRAMTMVMVDAQVRKSARRIFQLEASARRPDSGGALFGEPPHFAVVEADRRLVVPAHFKAPVRCSHVRCAWATTSSSSCRPMPCPEGGATRDGVQPRGRAAAARQQQAVAGQCVFGFDDTHHRMRIAEMVTRLPRALRRSPGNSDSSTRRMGRSAHARCGASGRYAGDDDIDSDSAKGLDEVAYSRSKPLA